MSEQQKFSLNKSVLQRNWKKFLVLGWLLLGPLGGLFLLFLYRIFSGLVGIEYEPQMGFSFAVGGHVLGYILGGIGVIAVWDN